MSVQAGVLNFDGRPADLHFLGKLSSAIEKYGPDGGNTYFDGPIGMAYRAFQTTPEARFECQPNRSSNGIVITWDGRLDNRDELVPQVLGRPAGRQTDLDIVSAAYEKWGINCFCKLIGDWALSIWNSREQDLLLARDYVGVRHLYYHTKYQSVAWCTNLKPLVLLAGTQFTLNDEYIAGFLALWPDAQLTPYREIHAVPPGKFVRIHNGEATIHSFWCFDTERQTRYKADAEYEEHFRQVFRQAVRRRLRCDSPILAELSGGLDSSSIVCMADDIMAKGEVEVPRIDTVSRYDTEEPGCDERSYFTKVEKQRGRTGFHIDVSKGFESFSLEPCEFVATPGLIGNAPHSNDEATEALQRLGHRVLLSGTGGDEFSGGVPDPKPLLADLLLQFRWRTFASQLMGWSLVKKTPWIQILLGSLWAALPLSVRTKWSKQNKPESWIDARFVGRYRHAIRRLGQSEELGFRLRAQQDHAQAFAAMARQMSISVPQSLGCQEKRYPFLDQTLVEFIVSIPADQLLQPGQRRFLMRRALANLLPREVLARTTKAVTARRFMIFFETHWAQLEDLFRSPLSWQLGFINPQDFLNALAQAKRGNAPHIGRLLRGLALEVWLQDSVRRGAIRVSTPEFPSMKRKVARVGA